MEYELIYDLPIENFEQEIEKVKWYQKRWQIESFYKILKSGFKVENCRISEGKRLIKYLTLMSRLSRKIQWLTWVFRENLESPANEVLSEDEITVLAEFFLIKNQLIKKIN